MAQLSYPLHTTHPVVSWINTYHSNLDEKQQLASRADMGADFFVPKKYFVLRSTRRIAAEIACVGA